MLQRTGGIRCINISDPASPYARVSTKRKHVGALELVGASAVLQEPVILHQPFNRASRTGGRLLTGPSFKNWEAMEAAAAVAGINGARPGTLALQQQKSPRLMVSVSLQAQAMIEYISPRPHVELDKAATKLQKIDSVYLNIKSTSFFDAACGLPAQLECSISPATRRPPQRGRGLLAQDGCSSRAALLRGRVHRHHLRGEWRWRVGRQSTAASCVCGWPAGISRHTEGLGDGTVTGWAE